MFLSSIDETWMAIRFPASHFVVCSSHKSGSLSPTPSSCYLSLGPVENPFPWCPSTSLGVLPQSGTVPSSHTPATCTQLHLGSKEVTLFCSSESSSASHQSQPSNNWLPLLTPGLRSSPIAHPAWQTSHCSPLCLCALPPCCCPAHPSILTCVTG